MNSAMVKNSYLEILKGGFYFYRTGSDVCMGNQYNKWLMNEDIVQRFNNHRERSFFHFYNFILKYAI